MSAGTKHTGPRPGVLHRQVRLDPAPAGPRWDVFPCLALAVIAIGVLWRLTRYALAFPLWGDEAMLTLHFLERDFAGMTRPLDRGQVAPLLFVLAEWGSFLLLGSSEPALRLVPFLASILSLPLFWMLARAVLPRGAALLALSLLAVSSWPVSMGSLVKPYSGDLFWALMLLVPAARIVKQAGPARLFWFWLLLACPLALFASFPALFVAGAIALTLLLAAWRRPTVETWVGLILFGGILLSAFGLNYLYVIARTPAVTRDFMVGYWSSGFPPLDALSLPFWLLMAHTGQMLAYPIGASSGGSTLTFFLVLLGAIAWGRHGDRRFLVLFLAPFALNLLASAIRCYPYGSSCRLAQHLAPSICLFAAAGLESLLRLPRWAPYRQRALLGILTALALIGIVGITRDLIRPYRGAGDLWSRKLARELNRHIQPEDRVVLAQPLEKMDAAFRWHLTRQGIRLLPPAEVDAADWRNITGNVWFLDTAFIWEPGWSPDFSPPAVKALNLQLTTGTNPRTSLPPQHFLLNEHGRSRNLTHYCGVYRWAREGQGTPLDAWAP